MTNQPNEGYKQVCNYGKEVKLMEQHNKCIQDCLDCYRVCLETKAYCLEKGGEHAAPSHIQSLDDCIELCKTSAHLMIAGSILAPQICDVCADACDRCATSCEAMEGDKQMQKCADICRKCEESCDDMAAEVL